MNTTTSASLCRTPRTARFFIALLAALMLTSGCALPTLGGPVSPHDEPALSTTELVVHAPESPKAEMLPAVENVNAWLEDIAPAKAKEDGAAAAATEAPPAPTTPVTRSCPGDGERVLLIGDSLSAGLGPHMGKRARACGTTYFVHGVVGSHVTQWVQPSWLKAQLHRAKPTIVMVSLGGNDFVRNDPQNVQRAIDGFVKTVDESGARLLWISPPTMPFPDKVGARTMWQTAIDGEVGVDWFATEQLEIERVSDRVHPTIAEYDVLAGKLWTWMSTVTQ